MGLIDKLFCLVLDHEWTAWSKIGELSNKFIQQRYCKRCGKGEERDVDKPVPKFKKKIKAKFVPDTKEEILGSRLKTYSDEGLLAWVRNTPIGKRIIFKIHCCKCKKISNTQSYSTAKRSKNGQYMCQACSDKRTGVKK